MSHLNGGVFILFLLALCILFPAKGGAATSKKDDISKKEFKEAQEERDAYAAHIYASECYNNGKSRIGMQFKKTGDQQKDLEGVEKACACMASALINAVGGNEVMDYMVFINGAKEDKGPAQAANSSYLAGASKTSKGAKNAQVQNGMKAPSVKGLPKELSDKITMGIPDPIKSVGEFERNPDNRKKCGYLR
ncbi:MAG: hypothetical protein WC043_00910 [Pseudobdellovibrionaceae bacterium]